MGTKDFVFKEEKHGAKKGKRQYLNKEMEHRVTESLNTLFRSKAKVPRKNIGEEQEVEAVVCEEALLFLLNLKGTLNEDSRLRSPFFILFWKEFVLECYLRQE